MISFSAELLILFVQSDYSVAEDVAGGEVTIDLELVSLSTSSPSVTEADIWVTLVATDGSAGKLFEPKPLIEREGERESGRR